ncbi:MAG: hypothetical protein LBC83_01340 [Oscillospiraceae bacterium]|jgi:hypothetical protein|nr:hypothetical protein [Oscillospiraceae bacterium]
MSKLACIICRAGTVLIALAAIPNIFFNGLLYARVDLGLGDTLWGDVFAIADFLPGGVWHGLLNGETSGALEGAMPLLRPAIAALCLVAATVLLLLAVAVISAVSNKRKLVLLLGGLGFLALTAAYICMSGFEKTVTAPDFSLLDYFGQGFLQSIFMAVLRPAVLMVRFAGAGAMLYVLLGAVLVWNGAFVVTSAPARK